MKYPKISFVTSCYNHKDFIGETIESVLNQNYPNLEYIVIDDGSTDGSWEIIQKYKDKLFHCERLEGYRDTPTVALNYAFSKVDGEIMGWLNSDDILLPGCFFTIAKIFNDNPKIKWVTGLASTINHKSELVNSQLRLKNKFDYLIGDWKVIQQESTFWRRDLWLQTGGQLNGKYKWAFDTELWTKFFMETEHYHADVPLGAFRRGQQSKSISNEQSFLVPNNKYLDLMKTKIGFKLKIQTGLYFICKKVLWPILALLPSKTIGHWSLLSQFTYKVVSYSFKHDSWVLKKVNPFRRYFV